MNYSEEFKKYATKHHGVNSMYYDKIISSMTPYIIEERQLNVAQMDVFSRLMMDRIIFLGTAINDSVANIIQNFSSKSQLDALAGGGDTLAAIKKAKANDAFKYLSTAGGAFLEWLEGNKSPGFIALRENNF